MTKEKQIEETARFLYHNLTAYNTCWEEDCNELAEDLYNEGYRKQSEGEWKKVYRNNQATVYECSNCHHLSFGASDYCICGAKMKTEQIKDYPPYLDRPKMKGE